MIVLNSDKKVFFYSLFESLNKLIINMPKTKKNYKFNTNFWQFLPFELIFDVSAKTSLKLEFRLNDESNDVYFKFLTMFCDNCKKYGKHHKMRRIEDLKMHTISRFQSELATCHQCWDMLYTKLINETKESFSENNENIDTDDIQFSYNSNYNCKLDRLILDISETRKSQIMISYNNHNRNHADNLPIITIHWVFGVTVDTSGDLNRIDYIDIRKQCNQMKLCPKNIELRMEGSIIKQIRSKRPHEFSRIYNQIFAPTETHDNDDDPLIPPGKIILRMMTRNNFAIDDVDYIDYLYSNLFLSGLLQNVNIQQWKNLDKFVVSIQWNLDVPVLVMRGMHRLSNLKMEHTIVTNPLVPLTIRKEFKYDESTQKNISCHTIDTKSDFKYKSFGNIFYNARQWISNYCANCTGETLTLKFCINFNYCH